MEKEMEKLEIPDRHELRAAIFDVERWQNAMSLAEVRLQGARRELAIVEQRLHEKYNLGKKDVLSIEDGVISRAKL